MVCGHVCYRRVNRLLFHLRLFACNDETKRRRQFLFEMRGVVWCHGVRIFYDFTADTDSGTFRRSFLHRIVHPASRLVGHRRRFLYQAKEIFSK